MQPEKGISTETTQGRLIWL